MQPLSDRDLLAIMAASIWPQIRIAPGIPALPRVEVAVNVARDILAEVDRQMEQRL